MHPSNRPGMIGVVALAFRHRFGGQVAEHDRLLDPPVSTFRSRRSTRLAVDGAEKRFPSRRVELDKRCALRRAAPGVELVEPAQQVFPLPVGIPLRDQQIHECRDSDIDGSRRIGAGDDRVRQRRHQRHLCGRERPARLGHGAAVQTLRPVQRSRAESGVRGAARWRSRRGNPGASRRCIGGTSSSEARTTAGQSSCSREPLRRG